jgi:hypothetical protein
MATPQVSRNLFGFVFTAGTVAVVLIITGLVGYQPPGHFSPADVTWRRGEWTDGVIWGQVAVGVAFLVAAAVAVTRINRRLSQEG